MKILKKYLKNEIVVKSFIVMIFIFIGNIFSYLFQVKMAERLGPEDYVIVAVITSLIAIFGIPSSAIQTVLAKNSVPLNMKNNRGRLKGMMFSSIKKLLYVSVFFFILYSLISIFLSSWLKIDYIYLFLTGFFIFGAFLYPVMSGMAQGMKKFGDFGFNFLLNCIIKFAVGMALIAIGLRVFGAIFGFLAGIFLSFFLFFLNFKDVLNSKIKKYEIDIFSKENLYPLIAMILFVFMFNIDVVFAKAFFTSEIAGKYSVASLIGKIILFVVSSVSTVMLPVSSEKHLSGKNTLGVLKKTLILSLSVCLLGIICLMFFPKLILSLLHFGAYYSVYSILIYVGIAFSGLSILNIFIIQAIATNRFDTKSSIILFICLIAEIILFFAGNQSIERFSVLFMVAGIIGAVGGYILYKRK
jgi:O-antigen/teichoic acid export membrane protein